MDVIINDVRLVVHLNVHAPIELDEFTSALAAFEGEFKVFLHEKNKQAGVIDKSDEYKLYVSKIENNCILAELATNVAFFGTALNVMEHANTYMDFITHIKNRVSILQQIESTKPNKVEDLGINKAGCMKIKDILTTAAKNKGGELCLKVIEYEKSEEKEKLRVKFNQEDSERATDGAKYALNLLASTQEADYKAVSMTLRQVDTERPKQKGKTGDLAIIESIHPEPLKVYFLADIDKEKIMHLKSQPDFNPLNSEFVVDVSVERRSNGTPIHYRVFRIYSD